ncbi:MAG: hypothetical protein R3B47_13515 [Bacteroidia bacterium]
MHAFLIGLALMALSFFSVYLLKNPKGGISVHFSIETLLPGLLYAIWLVVGKLYTISKWAYVGSGLLRWMRKPWILMLLLFVVLTISPGWDAYNYLSNPIFSENNLGWLLLAMGFRDTVIAMLLAFWLINSDGLEVIAGFLGAQFLWRQVIGGMEYASGNGTAKDQILTYTDTQGGGYSDIFLGIGVHVFIFILATAIFTSYFGWKNWRSRLFSRYEAPDPAEPWNDHINEIGKP